MKLFFSLITLTLLISCGETTTREAANLPGFEISKIAGTDFSKAVKKDPESGQVVEEGELYQGRLSGTWVKYDESKQTVETISTFVDGLRNGLYLEFNSQGKISKQARYRNDQLHGLAIDYNRNTRKEKEANYTNGQLDGLYIEYNQSGKMTKEVEYKNGKQDGFMRCYNQDGVKTVEYIFKNGEKVSGGAITNPK